MKQQRMTGWVAAGVGLTALFALGATAMAAPVKPDYPK